MKHEVRRQSTAIARRRCRICEEQNCCDPAYGKRVFAQLAPAPENGRSGRVARGPQIKGTAPAARAIRRARCLLPAVQLHDLTVAMNPTTGILLKLGAVTAFSVMQVFLKSTDGRVPPGEMVFFRSFFAFPVILVWLGWRRELSVAFTTRRPMSHVWRGVIGTAAMGTGFAGLLLLPLPAVTAISYAAPILTVVFAAMFLGETIRAFRITAVVLGMIGVMIVLAPRLAGVADTALGATEALGATLVLMSATFAALAQIFLRRMAATERAATVVLYFTLTSTLFSLFTIPFGWVMPARGDLALMVLAGLFGGVGQGFLTSAYHHAHASVIAPFDYASMLYAVAFGYFVFAEVPAQSTLIGASLIIVAGIVIIWRERRLGLSRDKARRSATPG